MHNANDIKTKLFVQIRISNINPYPMSAFIEGLGIRILDDPLYQVFPSDNLYHAHFRTFLLEMLFLKGVTYDD